MPLRSVQLLIIEVDYKKYDYLDFREKQGSRIDLETATPDENNTSSVDLILEEKLLLKLDDADHFLRVTTLDDDFEEVTSQCTFTILHAATFGSDSTPLNSDPHPVEPDPRLEKVLMILGSALRDHQ